MLDLNKLNKKQKSTNSNVHPKVRAMSDVVAFRLARLVAAHERDGSYWFNKNFQLSLTQWRVLGLSKEFEPIMFKDIRLMLNIDKGQLSRAVKHLVSRDILFTNISKKDARLVEIHTTSKGKKLHGEVLKFSILRNELIVKNLTKLECQEFFRLLEKISSVKLEEI